MYSSKDAESKNSWVGSWYDGGEDGDDIVDFDGEDLCFPNVKDDDDVLQLVVVTDSEAKDKTMKNPESVDVWIATRWVVIHW